MNASPYRLPILIAFTVVCFTTFRSQAATITVSHTADSGPGSLRDALASATDGDTIDASGVTGAILLTNGELLVTNSVDIVGPGPGLLAVDGNGVSRVFFVGSNVVASISGTAIRNGSVSSFSLVPAGGGIFNQMAALTVSNVVITGNSADHGGGICVANASDDAGTLRSGNASLKVVGSEFIWNRGTTGGAIINFGYGPALANVEIQNSTFTSNAAFYGGAVAVQARGGTPASLHISGCTFSDNSARDGSGGAVFNQGASGGRATARIVNSTFSLNRARTGGGVYHTSFNDGQAKLGLLNCTFSGNSASYAGGTVVNHLDGFSGGGGWLEIGSSILDEGGGSGGTIVSYGGTVVSLGYNVSSDAGGGVLTAASDQTNTDPLLDPTGLQDNGGPTRTIALQACSPAADQGNNLSSAATDQRGSGFSRTVDDPGIPNAAGGDGTDIGAFEAQPPLADMMPPTITCPAARIVNATLPDGAVVNYPAAEASDNCGIATLTYSQDAGTVFPIGTTTVTVTAVDAAGNTNACSFTVKVKSASEQIADLIALVHSLPGVKAGTKNALVVKLNDAQKSLGNGNLPSACSKLQDFINLTKAQTAKKELTAEQAAQLIAEATRIRAVLACP
jgi:hypothetical protein